MYAGGDPVNKFDPNGETDIYIGGAGDTSTSKIVKNYASSQSSKGGRTVGYFSYNDAKGAINFAKANSGNGEPLNIIGHSYGASEAVEVTNALGKEGIYVDTLVGVDGVRQAFSTGELKTGSVGDVVSIDNSGTGSSGDTIEGAGKALGGLTTLGSGTPRAFKSNNADVSISYSGSHEDFSGAMNSTGSGQTSAVGIINQTYEDYRIE